MLISKKPVLNPCNQCQYYSKDELWFMCSAFKNTILGYDLITGKQITVGVKPAEKIRKDRCNGEFFSYKPPETPEPSKTGFGAWVSKLLEIK